MVQKTNLEKSKDAYCLFLTEFMKNPNFDDLTVTTALKSVYKNASESLGQLQSHILARLIIVVLNNKEQILNDIETLTDSSELSFDLLKSNDIIQKLNQIFFEETNNGRKLRSNAIDTILKLASSTRKRKYSNRKRVINKNKSLIQSLKIDKNNSSHELEKIPLVTLQKNEKLQDMAKRYCTQKKQEESEKTNQNSESNNENMTEKNKENETENAHRSETSNGAENTYRNETSNSTEYTYQNEISNGTETEDSSNFEISNNNLEVWQTYENQDEYVDLSNASNYITVKHEANLLENSPQLHYSQPESDDSQLIYQNNNNEAVCNNLIETKCKLPVASLVNRGNLIQPVSYCNNFVPQLSMHNHINAVQNTAYNMTNVNCCNSCMTPAMHQCNPNIIVMNSLGFMQAYPGMYNQFLFNPYASNTIVMHQNFGMMIPQLQPQPSFNGVIQPPQDFSL